MPDRKPVLAANWKMHKTVGEAERYVAELLPAVASAQGCEVVLCPPFTALAAVVEATRGSVVAVAAQTMHAEEEGAFTGEVSARMLTELDVGGVVLGHSERRELFGETDEALARKVPAALEAGLQPILCVGETESEREAGWTEQKLCGQIDADLAGVPRERLAGILVAYEPIWAIGTGKTATPAQAQEAIGFLRSHLAKHDGEAAQAIRILYGGSVKPENAAEILSQPDVDGALVGGASLDAQAFAAIVAAA